MQRTDRAWPRVSQTSGRAFLTGWCAISRFYEKGKVSALTALTECNFSSLYTVFRETNASESDLMKAEKAYTCISAWYGQTKGTSLAEASYLLYTLKRGKHMKVMSLPPTTPNLSHHTLQVMPSYLILSCEHIMPSWLVKLLTSKAHPTYILQSLVRTSMVAFWF